MTLPNDLMYWFTNMHILTIVLLNLHISHRLRYTKIVSLKMLIFSYPSVLTYVLGAQKNRLNETVLLSTYNICFG